MRAATLSSRERSAVDFGDLIMRPALLLQENAALRTAVQLRHRHVLVDEYQDVNRASTELLQQIAGNGERLWTVGDARQSIYRFRGASSANLPRFLTQYPSAKTTALKLNYRSSPRDRRAVAAELPPPRSRGSDPVPCRGVS